MITYSVLHPSQNSYSSLFSCCKFYIIKQTLKDHGYTPGCPACIATEAGRRTTNEHHTAACRSCTEKSVLESRRPKDQQRFEDYVDQAEARTGKKRQAEAPTEDLDPSVVQPGESSTATTVAAPAAAPSPAAASSSAAALS